MAAQDLSILSKFKDEKRGEGGRKAILNAKRPGNDYRNFPGSTAERGNVVGGNGCGVASQLANLYVICNTPS